MVVFSVLDQHKPTFELVCAADGSRGHFPCRRFKDLLHERRSVGKLTGLPKRCDCPRRSIDFMEFLGPLAGVVGDGPGAQILKGAMVIRRHMEIALGINGRSESFTSALGLRLSQYA